LLIDEYPRPDATNQMSKGSRMISLSKSNSTNGVHVAIDRLTGQVIDKQIETVNE